MRFTEYRLSLAPMFNKTSNPYEWRTKLRGSLPWPLWKWIPKGTDCEAVGASHVWYNIDGNNSGCYHCEIERPGRLWQSHKG